MYMPEQHRESRREVMHDLMRSHPLGAWVTIGDGALVANHIPFDLDPSRGEHGTLVGHVARSNPVWRQPSEHPCMVIFQGPQSYVSPSWYPSKHEHGKAVPTWNYAVVHAHGRAAWIQDHAWLHEHVSALSRRHESSQALPWAVSDAPADYIDRMIGAIVGVEIRIDRLEGKWKMSQNRTEPDRLGVVAGLLARRDAQAAAVAAVVRNIPESPQ